jgi:hypothetical protein
VATPVWFVARDGRLLVITDENSFKAKRIRRNPAVTYRLDRIFILPLYRTVQRLRGAGLGSETAFLAITPL